jgi:hypothetical protein
VDGRADSNFGYAAKRMAEECSMTGLDDTERYTSMALELCIRNFSKFSQIFEVKCRTYSTHLMTAYGDNTSFQVVQNHASLNDGKQQYRIGDVSNM